MYSRGPEPCIAAVAEMYAVVRFSGGRAAYPSVNLAIFLVGFGRLRGAQGHAGKMKRGGLLRGTILQYIYTLRTEAGVTI